MTLNFPEEYDINTRGSALPHLNRDFYIKMRLKGYKHEDLVEGVFPPERKGTFVIDIEGLENVDYTKKIDIEKLVYGDKKTKTNTEAKPVAKTKKTNKKTK